jgi:Bifunctional DNA primase/polymerase, N-terminal
MVERVRLAPKKSSNADLAKRLASHGVYVFPANPETKRPMVKWKKGSTTDLVQIDKWWRRPWIAALPAIDLGKSGLFVIDADRHDADKDGVAAVIPTTLPWCGRRAAASTTISNSRQTRSAIAKASCRPGSTLAEKAVSRSPGEPCTRANAMPRAQTPPICWSASATAPFPRCPIG